MRRLKESLAAPDAIDLDPQEKLGFSGIVDACALVALSIPIESPMAAVEKSLEEMRVTVEHSQKALRSV